MEATGERKKIIAYLENELKGLVKHEHYYLIEGVRWAKDRIAGKPISEQDYEPEPISDYDGT